MDILNIIREKISSLKQHGSFMGLEAVITHIETAERYLSRGKEEKDDNLYTDAIYRTNHAFEGILKEAYTVLTSKASTKITPYEIENYLVTSNVLKQRVMDLFTNYRREWRNPSTHDYNLFFSEQEAFLAIVNVSAFVNILLDQIIEQSNFQLERERTLNRAAEIKASIKDYHARSLPDKISQLLIAFTQDVSDSTLDGDTEAEVLGLLTGFVSSVDPTIHARSEEISLGSFVLRPDVVLWQENESVILELKLASPRGFDVERARHQLISYLTASPNINDGVLFFFPADKKETMIVDNLTVESPGGDIKKQIVVVRPHDLPTW
jgi:hypothetical protein